jgi:predicted lipid-binding transport protein (Tim44 family)
MEDVFDIYTIIFLALAVFIFLRLRSVLGQRTGRERPPYDPFTAREPARPAGENVVALPHRAGEPTAAKPGEAETAEAETTKVSGDRWKGIAEAGSPLAVALDAVVGADRNFDPAQFLAGARAAYEMIVNAFAEGDRRSLKSLLSREVYDGFDSAIAEREMRGDVVESRFVSIDNAEITAAELRGRIAQLTVRFQCKLVSVTRNKAGDVIDGNADKVTDVTDVWTFARDLASRDPNWKLVATEAGQ